MEQNNQVQEEFKEEVIHERARFVDRFFAAVVDNLTVTIPLRFLWFILNAIIISKLNLMPVLVTLIYYVINFCAIIGYFAVYAYKHNGQTIAKKWMKLKVVNLKGEEVGLYQFVWREFLARGIVVLGVFLFGNIANVWILTYLLALTKERRALHDIIAGTQVVTLKS